MAGIRVGMVQINVSDLEDAWKFYVETLGIPGRRSLGPSRPFELVPEGGPGSPTVLVYPVRDRTPRDYPDAVGVTLVFHTDDIREAVRRWQAKGVELVPIAWSTDASGIADTPFGPFIAFRDPFGNVHELLQPVERARRGDA